MISQIKVDLDNLKKGCGKEIQYYEKYFIFNKKVAEVICGESKYEKDGKHYCDVCQAKISQAEKDLKIAEEFIEKLKEELGLTNMDFEKFANMSMKGCKEIIDKLASATNPTDSSPSKTKSFRSEGKE